MMFYFVLVQYALAAHFAALDHSLKGLGQAEMCDSISWCHNAFCQTLQLSNVSYVTFVLDESDHQGLCMKRNESDDLWVKMFMIGQLADLSWAFTTTCDRFDHCMKEACDMSKQGIMSFIIGGICS